MSVNIYDGTNLTPIAGKTVPMPTPDYVDAQYNSTTTYTKGMTCISGNKRYRYINSTASSGHQPPNATYWEVYSVADELNPTYTNTNMTFSSKVQAFVNGSDTLAWFAKVGKIVFFSCRLQVKSGQTLSNPEVIISGLPPFAGSPSAGQACFSSCVRNSNDSNFASLKSATVLANDSTATSAMIYLYSSASLTANADIYITGQYISK